MENIIEIATNKTGNNDGQNIYFDLNENHFYNHSGDVFSVEEMLTKVCFANNDWDFWHPENFYKAIKKELKQ